jgi:hypothetical protein
MKTEFKEKEGERIYRCCIGICSCVGSLNCLKLAELRKKTEEK